MSSYYILPANLNFKKVQTIPVDTQHRLFQNLNGIEAAQKIQNLNTFFYEDDVEVPSTITTTVAQVLANDPDNVTAQIPAYRVHVHGWTNLAVNPTGALNIVGGLPRSFTSNQMVNTSKTSTILPQGTLTLYTEPVTPGEIVVPGSIIISDTAVVLNDIPTEPFPTWVVSIDTPYPLLGDTFIEFDFSFNLYTQPQFTYA